MPIRHELNKRVDRMDIKVLRYFLALAKEESVTGAANYLHITQPTLSRQLSELEENLGTELFIRGPRRITLTEDGIRLRKRAEEILSLVNKTQSEFLESKESISGDVYIGGGESYVMGIIARTIKAVQSDYPNIRFHLFSGDAEDVKGRIDSGLLDFCVLIQPTNLDNYETLTLPLKDRWGVLMQKDSPLAKKEVIQPQDIWQLPLITSKQHTVDDNIEKWLKKSYSSLNIVGTYNLLFNATLLVEQGVGYALCIDHLANTSNESTLCFRPFEPSLEVAVDLVWKRYQLFSKPAEVFLRYIQNIIS